MRGWRLLFRCWGGGGSGVSVVSWVSGTIETFRGLDVGKAWLGRLMRFDSSTLVFR